MFNQRQNTGVLKKIDLQIIDYFLSLLVASRPIKRRGVGDNSKPWAIALRLSAFSLFTPYLFYV